MKTYKSSDLTHKRAEVLKEAKANGVVIQECNTNGDVRCEYVLTQKRCECHANSDGCCHSW